MSSGARSRDPLARKWRGINPEIRPHPLFLFFPCKVGNETTGEGHKARGDLIADGEIAIAMRHHAKSLRRVDENDVVGNVRTGLRRGGAANQRCRVNRALPAGALLDRVRRAARGAEAAAEILPRAAGRAGLIDDRFRARGPVRELPAAAHRVRSRNMLTWDESTPPSPCNNATEASRT